MNQTEQVLDFVKEKGPVLPAEASSAVGTSILFASAMLSELSSKGHVHISRLKVGGSPLYYVPGQETKLQNYLDKLGEKPRRAVEMLREKKILRDRELDPVTRVALRETKDFAKPIEVIAKDTKELFWKWYLLGKEETEEKVKRLLGMSKPKEEQHVLAPENARQQAAATAEQEKAESTIETTAKKLKTPTPRKAASKNDAFLERVTAYFNQNNIRIVEQKVLRRNAEAEFVIRVPNAVGTFTCYCKAKNKKQVSDGDVSAAYMQGQLRKLPVLVLSPGALTKKAEALLATDLNINFKTI